MAGIHGIGSFDVQATCSGFVYALTVASQFIETGKCRKIVLVGADKMSAVIDYTDRATCVLFGDGAGAVLIEPSKKYGIMDARDPSPTAPAPSICTRRQAAAAMPPSAKAWPGACIIVHQEGAAVYKFAVARMADVAVELMERNRLTQRHGRLAGAAPGQQAHHRGHGRAPEAADGSRDGDDPQIRQHHRGHDPAVPVGLRGRSSRPATACCWRPSAAASPGRASI